MANRGGVAGVNWHVLKTQVPVWADVDSEKKSFEIRVDDCAYAVGDILELREYDGNVGMYTGRVCYRQVTYTMRPRDLPFLCPLSENGCAMAIIPLTKEEAFRLYRESGKQVVSMQY